MFSLPATLPGQDLRRLVWRGLAGKLLLWWYFLPVSPLGPAGFLGSWPDNSLRRLVWRGNCRTRLGTAGQGAAG